MWNNPETITTTLDSMKETSLELKSFYVYKYCAPTRGSFLSGRYPYKLCATRNNLNPAQVPEGINLGYTYITEKLATASQGYVSYQIGKWHQGYYKPDYTPVGRGFNYSYGFLSGGEDHYNQHNFWGCNNAPAIDLYENNAPAYGKNNHYNGYDFTNKAIEYIKNHKINYSDNPMFLYFALHNTHAPNEAPSDIIAKYNFSQKLRNTFDAMETIVDESVLNVTNALKENDMWNNTLFIWTTDNGSPVTVAGSNYPFRGSKGNNFEGGVHVPAIISGGLLPNEMKGKSLDGLIHISDFYSTFCRIAGNINPNETNPNAPSNIDSIDMWDYITGKISNSPRNIIVHDHLMYTNITQGTIRQGKYKLVVMNESEAGWYGEFSPNQSWEKEYQYIYACSVDNPCLFDIENDITEHNDISESNPNIVHSMLELFHSYDNEYHPPTSQPPPDTQGYCNALYSHNNFTIPWQ